MNRGDCESSLRGNGKRQCYRADLGHRNPAIACQVAIVPLVYRSMTLQPGHLAQFSEPRKVDG